MCLFFVHVIQHHFNIYQHNPILELQSLPLGKVLYHAGLLSAEELQQILEKQKEEKYGVYLGDIIKESGLLSPETIEFFCGRITRNYPIKSSVAYWRLPTKSPFN